MANSHHYFATSFVYWRVAETKAEVIEKMDKLDHLGDTYRIYKVPLPLEAHYQIDHYRPVVQGVELVS